MAENPHPVDQDRPDALRQEPTDSTGTESIESYETEGGVVLYDAMNPLAWMLSSQTVVLTDAV